MADLLEIFTLGGLRLHLGGKPFSDLNTRKVEALLVYTALNGQPQPRETLATLLWEDSSQSSALTNLRVALSDLRKKLGHYVNITRHTVALDKEAPIWFDVGELERRLDGPHELKQLGEAVDLYRGDFLEGFHLRGARQFEDWVAMQNERIRQRVLGAYGALVRRHLADGSYAEGITVAQAWLQHDPLDEAGHRLLMQLHVAQGQKARALSQYEACCRLLAEELGVDPSAETTALYEEIVAGRRQVGPGAKLLPPHNLPAPLTPFIGREKELEILDRLLTSSDVRLITIVAPGGMGKTRLAVAAARRQLDRATFPDGAFFVNLVGRQEEAQIVPAMAQALDFSFSTGSDPRQQFLDYLRKKRLLLILDNFVHLRDEARVIVELMRSAPHVQAIVTSREQLQLHAEQILPLQGLPFEATPVGDKPHDGDPPQNGEKEQQKHMMGTPASRLFLQTAQRVRHDLALESGDASHLARICRLVDGMPLALELAAGWIGVLSLAEIAGAIEHSFDLLETVASDIPARHRSMRAVFDTTWRRLRQSEKTQLVILSLFPGGFDRTAAQEVAAADPTDLSAMVAKSLLSHDHSAERYQVHELLRQYASERLSDTTVDRDEALDKLADFYCTFLQQQESALHSSGQSAAIAAIATEIENALVAWRWATRTQQWEQLRRAANSMGTFFLWRNRYQEAETLFRQATEQFRATAQPDPTLALLLAWQATFNRFLLNFDAAQEQLRRSLNLLEAASQSDDVRSISAFVHLQAGHLHLEQAYYELGDRHFRQSRQQYRDVDNMWGQAEAQSGLAEIANRQGDFPGARSLYEKSLELFRACGDAHGSAHALERLSWVYRDIGELQLAEATTQEAVSLYEELGDREKSASGYLARGWALLYMGRFQEALQALEKSAALFSDLGRPLPLYALGIVNIELGLYDEGHALLQRHLSHSRARDDQAGIAEGLNPLSNVAVVTGRYEEAHQYLVESTRLLQSTGQRDRLGHVHAFRGYAARGLGKRAEAWYRFRLALEIGVETHAIIPILFALPGVALLLADEGEVERARRLYAPLAQMPIVANSQMRADLAGTELEEKIGRFSAGEMEPGSKQEWDLWQATRELLESWPAP